MSSQNHATLVEIGHRIRDLRRLKRWTQTDMAVSLDIARTYISEVENGKRELGVITLQIIARGLGTTMSKLLNNL
jgi:transcriptional regulator with XRE-family HTH domain